MTLITTQSYHDIKLIKYIDNYIETKSLDKFTSGSLIGVYYNNNNDIIQLEYYKTIQKHFMGVIDIIEINQTDLELNLANFKLVICLDDLNFDIIEKCYNLNILVVSNYKSTEPDTEFIDNYCIKYTSIKNIINIIEITNSSDTFGIIIPVYNCENYIEKTIISVLSQTYKNYIIYIIDDCSTDNSLQVIKKYSHLPNVVITSNEKNLGKFMTINKVLADIKTKYYLIVDSDDIIIKNRLVYDMIEFTRYKSIFAVASKWYRYNETNNFLVRSPYFCPNNCTYKTEIIKKIGLYWNTRFGGDTEYIMRFYKFIGAKYIVFLDKITCVAIHRFDENNLTLQVPLGSTKRKKFINLFKKYHDEIYINLNEIDRECKNINVSKIFNDINSC